MNNKEKFPFSEETQSRFNTSIGVAAGAHAVGSSTVAKLLSHVLDLPYVSAGGVVRRFSRVYCNEFEDEEVKLRAVGKWFESEPSRDGRIDRYVLQRAFNKARSPVIFEGKTVVALAKDNLLPGRTGELEQAPSGHFILPILLTCTPEISARRALFRDSMNRSGKIIDYRSEEAAQILRAFSEEQVRVKLEELQLRAQEGQQRWEQIYQLQSKIPYALTIDTSELFPEQVASIILQELLNRQLLNSSHTLKYQSTQQFVEQNNL